MSNYKTKTINKITFTRIKYERSYYGKQTEGKAEVYCNGEHVGDIYSDICEETFVRIYGVYIWDNEFLKPGAGAWDDYFRCGQPADNSMYVVPSDPRAALNYMKRLIKEMFI